MPAGSPRATLRHPGRAVLLVWLCFLVRGAFFCAVLPLWEGFDEYAHFAYVQRVHNGDWLIQPGARATREVERSISLVPMPWTQRAEPPPHETYESYWRLPPEERRARERELHSLARPLAAEDSQTALPAESQQPPLTYWLMAALYQLTARLSLPGRVLALRLLNVCLGSAIVPATWIIARRLFGAGAALAGAAVVALVPELMFDVARVANSGLAVALYSVLTVLCLEAVECKRAAALWTGAVLGIGLLTKAFFICAVPAVAAVLAWAVWKRGLRLRVAAAALAMPIAIAGWWYGRNLRITGGFSGVLQDAALRHMPLTVRLVHIREVNWLAALDSTFFSHVWFGGWSFLQMRAWIYHAFAVVAVLAVIGVAVAWFREARARQDLTVLGSIYLLFCGGVAYHVLLTFLANGISSSAGWYLCAVLAPEIVLALVGLRALAPAPFWPYVSSSCAIAVALLDLYGLLFVALPYYAGLTGHRPVGGMESFHFASLSSTGLAEVFCRLATNKPGFVGSGVMAASGCAYIAATAGLVAVAVVVDRRFPGRTTRCATPRR